MNDKNAPTREKFDPDVVRAHYLNNIEKLYAEMERNERRHKAVDKILSAIMWSVVVVPIALIILNDALKAAGHH